MITILVTDPYEVVEPLVVHDLLCVPLQFLLKSEYSVRYISA